MSFFELFFRGGSHKEPQPKLSFGRYTDSYKVASQYDSWDKALDLFEQKEYLSSYLEFFNYLRDNLEDNVTWKEDHGKIFFEIYQGSKKITGIADTQKVTAEAKVAQTKTLNIGFMRRLLERNFVLRYSRFALDEDNNITIRFDTNILDGSPYKLYYAFKELATNADKLDDVLVDEFKMLEPVSISHLVSIPSHEKEVKYQFLIQEIEAAIAAMDSGKPSLDKHPGGYAYVLLNLTYKLDYLIRPEGFMMETLERIHRMYFSNDGKNPAQKNVIIRKELKKLLARSKEDFFKEMYLTKSTFGVTKPVNHDRVIGFIDGELHHMDWYNEHEYDTISIAIPGYVVGYCMFNFAIPLPDRALFHLYYQVVEASYFKKLGYTLDYYDAEKNTFNKNAIKRRIKEIVHEYGTKYGKMNPNKNSLKFDSIPNFAKSFLLMVRNLDLTKTA
ncbi:MAG TPA: hypothetical protein ENJ53_06480 [Phaeodactylibacter sp.]|nr:hypothetical protein [Phaeodactylibacter sp.]